MSDATAFVDRIKQLRKEWKIDTLIPITEESLLSLLRARDELGDVVVPFPSHTAFAAISDKENLMRVAADAGIAVPEQWVVSSAAAAEALLAGLPYPVVAKPARSVSEADGVRVKLNVAHAANAAQLSQQLADLPPAAFPVLIQRRIVGPGLGIFLLIWDNQVRAVFAHRRLREKPPSGGVSVYCESIIADQPLIDAAADLLRRFDWRGVAMVEMKLDESRGVPYLMEVNGRFWGSLQLAIDAGVDFPRLLVECAHGNPPRAIPEYSAGVRSRWLWGDVDHLIARMRRSRIELALPPEAGGRMSALRDFLQWRRRDKADVFRWTDPRPLLRETLDWLARR